MYPEMNLKILLLTTHFNTGGITSYLLTLARGLVDRGQKVFIVSSGGNCVDELAKIGVQHFTFNIRTKSEASWRLYFPLPRLVRLVRDLEIDVIHAQTRVTQVMGTLLGRLTQQPLVTTCHGFYKPKFFRKFLGCWGRTVIAISPPVKEHLEKDFGVPTEKIALIRNGIVPSNFPLVTEDLRTKKRIEHRVSCTPVLGIIARLADVKGHGVLIEAMTLIRKKFPNVQLLIIGEGKMDAVLRAQVKHLDLSDHVHFHPVVNQTAEFLPLFDVFVMPSLEEGLGLSVMEAQACGLAVVASRVGGIPSFVEHGKTGWLVEPNNPEELARAVIELLENPGRAKSMGERARAYIQQECSADLMAEQTQNIYRRHVVKHDFTRPV